MNKKEDTIKETNCNEIENLEPWRDKAYAFFNHKDCEFFPCHNTDEPDQFNCLFCYCPLYALKDKCGGNFSYTEKGIKDCSKCTLPHKKDNYGYIMKKFGEIIAITKLDGNGDE